MMSSGYAHAGVVNNDKRIGEPRRPYLRLDSNELWRQLMSATRRSSCLIKVDNAELYAETFGKGDPLVMIHAGVADSRQWNNEFEFFAARYRVIRYDMRGYGRSEPAEGEFSHLRDLLAVLDGLNVDEPAVLMGCSIGANLAMDMALEQPARVRALILVGGGVSGLEYNGTESPKVNEAEQAWKDGDIERTAELETQIWFDGEGRSAQQVDQSMRRLAVEMNRLALSHAARKLGTRLPEFVRCLSHPPGRDQDPGADHRWRAG